MSETAATPAEKPLAVGRDRTRAAFGRAALAGLAAALAWSWHPAEMDRWTYRVGDAGTVAECASGFL